MYDVPEGYERPTEVDAYTADLEKLGVVHDLDNWYISEDWAATFRRHAETLKSLADGGEPWSQYHLANLYILGCIYPTREEWERNYLKDAEIATAYLVQCAKHGFVGAVDNICCNGVGEEAERLREIARSVEKSSPELIGVWEGEVRMPVYTPSFFEEVWRIAYGRDT